MIPVRLGNGATQLHISNVRTGRIPPKDSGGSDVGSSRSAGWARERPPPAQSPREHARRPVSAGVVVPSRSFWGDRPEAFRCQVCAPSRQGPVTPRPGSSLRGQHTDAAPLPPSLARSDRPPGNLPPAAAGGVFPDASEAALLAPPVAHAMTRSGHRPNGRPAVARRGYRHLTDGDDMIASRSTQPPIASDRDGAVPGVTPSTRDGAARQVCDDTGRGTDVQRSEPPRARPKEGAV